MESLNAAKIIEECKMSGEEVVNIVAAHGEDQFIHVVDIEEFAVNHDRLVEENAELREMLSDYVHLVENDSSEDFLYRFNEIKELLNK